MYIIHCESGKELWLQREAALETQSFRDAEPQLVINPPKKKNHEIPFVQLRPGINICLTITDPFLPTIAWTCNDAYCSWSSQLVPSNLIIWQYFFPFVPYCMALPKKCPENRGLVVLLQIWAKDLTVSLSLRAAAHSGFGLSDWPIWTDFVAENFRRRALFFGKSY